MEKFNFYMPSRVLFGRGRLNDLATVKLPGKKALIVTTNGKSVKKYGYLDRVLELLKSNNGTQAVIFDKILPNPVNSHVNEAAAICRREGCDFVIGLGGGSAIDSAKSIAVMAVNEGDYWEYVKGKKAAGALPVIAITTTAGTGTEADPFTVITNENTHEKEGYGIDHTFPVLSIVDPDLMATVPAKLTAYQGFDAFFHAAEGYIAKTANTVSDLFALKSMSLLNEYLPRAVADGSDMEAREKVGLANTLSGMVEATSSCTSEHSLEHAMSGIYPELPHGAGLIMISRAYFSHFAPHVAQRFTEMAENMGVDTSRLPEAQRPMAFVGALAAMQKACGVHDLAMSEYGIRREDLPRMTKLARDSMGGLYQVDRVALSDNDVLKIYEASYS